MTAEPVPLRLINADTGEIESTDWPARVQHLEDQLAGAEREIRAWRMRYAELRRDKEQEAKASPLWPKALELFKDWKKRCKHPRCRWSADRFFLIEPFLKDDGEDLCLKAILGAEFDAFTTRRKNGTVWRHDEWELIYKDRKSFESFVNRAPRS